MPIALYGISFRETGNLLAVCSFEKQTLADKKAADELLQKLIGDKLQIGIGELGFLELSVSDLAVDLIDAKQDFERLTSNVYGYRLKLENNAKPGDATDKVVEPANTKLVNSMALTSKTMVTVTLSKPEGAFGTKVFLVFEGTGPIESTTTANASTAIFSLDPSLNLKTDDFYRALFIKDESPVTPGYLKAP